MDFAFMRTSEVLKNEEERNLFVAFSSMIRKDLEIMYWHNKVINVFGEFQLFSEMKDELGNFELLLSIKTGETLDQIEHSLLGEATSVCSSNFLDQIITLKKKFYADEFYILSEKYTKYLLEIAESHNGGNLLDEYSQITAKFFRKNEKREWVGLQ